MKFSFHQLLSGTVMVAAVFVTAARGADVFFNVHIDTSSLVANSAAPFYLDFQLNDGSGIGNGNNRAFLSQFNFSGGMALADIGKFGGASGSLTSGVDLIDTSFINEFFQAFKPGSALDFRLRLSTNVDAPTPDLFAFSILDKDLFSLETTSLSGAFVTIDITPGPLSPQAFAGIAPGSRAVIAAPIVASVPEFSSTITYFAISILALLGLAKIIRVRSIAHAARLS